MSRFVENKKEMSKVNYEVKSSYARVQQLFSELITEMQNHLQVLQNNEQPLTSFRAKYQKIKIHQGMILDKEIKIEIKKQDRKREVPEKIADLVKEASEKFKINLYPIAREGLLNEKGLKYALIKKEYFERARTGEKYKDIQEDLSVKYDVSPGSIRRHMNPKINNEN